ncbi:MAG: hypothetical protein AAGA54_08785 [Myxococcota bacterium]
MKITTHTTDRLVFEHNSIALGVIIVLFTAGGIAAGIAALTMHQTLSFDDDFIRLGIGMILGFLLVGTLVFGAAVRKRRLIFDRIASEITVESLGLWKKAPRRWPLQSIRSVKVSETYLGGTKRVHSTEFTFADGSTGNVGSMDPPTVGAIERNVATMRQWLANAGVQLSGPA